MNKREYAKLRIGQYVTHDRYGFSKVDDINAVGTVILPETYNGKILLYFDCHDHPIFKDYVIGVPFIEDDYKHLTPYTPSWENS